jgi:mannose-1-phosphate guanylyltransferase/mannose-6-phosphate isomerase
MKIIPVILAGGSGTRLWPLSKPSTPKQFLKLFGDRTLLQETIERIQPLTATHILVVTGENLRMETDSQVRELGLGPDLVTVLAEPMARNTAPAIALAAAWVRDQHGGDARMVVLPADHHIGERDKFLDTIRQAIDVAAEDVLVTLGIRPTGPETGYGYIHAGAVEGASSAVKAFVEKPDFQRATQYLASGDYFWNSGMFIWQADAVLRAIAQHLPEVAALAGRPWAEFQAHFAEAPKISVDYGILEKAANVRMVPAQFAWSDVGTWDSVASFLRADGRLASAAVEVDCESVDVYSSRRVAVIGLDEVMIIDGDEGLLVMKKGHGQSVGTVAKVMAERTEALGAQTVVQTRTVKKPWGQELIWADTPLYCGKILSIRKGESLSLQYHREKDETIHVLSGSLRFRYGGNPDTLIDKVMAPGESFHIATRTVHQMEALEDCEILEVSTPQLQDVVRLLDRYGRVGA